MNTGLKEEVTCPLGSKCVDVTVDGIVQRCAWHTNIQGVNPQDGSEMNTWKCAIAWIPVLQVNQSRVSTGTNAAIENLRNHQNEVQTKAVQMLASLGGVNNAKSIESE